MGDENLNSYYVRSIYTALALFVALVFTSWIFGPLDSMVLGPQDKPKPTPNPAFKKTIIIMEAFPVDNEPGAYILKYSNGVIEIMYSDGSRKLLTPQPEESNDDRIQSVRPNSDVNRR